MSILIRWMDKPKSCNACMFDVYGLCLINKHLEGEDELTHDCPLHELPEHGDLIDRDAVEYTYAFHGLLMTSNKILDKLPTIVGADKELLEKAHKEFIEEASKNRAVKYEQEVKSIRDFLLELRDEAKEIKNGNVPFPERSGK